MLGLDLQGFIIPVIVGPTRQGILGDSNFELKLAQRVSRHFAQETLNIQSFVDLGSPHEDNKS